MYSNFLQEFILPLGDGILGTNYIRQVQKWRYLQGRSSVQLESLQEKNLRKLLNHAMLKVPYYRNLNVVPSLNIYETLSKFPILTKAIIKEDIDSFIYGDKEELVAEKSSGSSGIQGMVYLTKQEISQSQAIQTLWWEWAGYKFGNKILQTGITPNRGFIKSIKDFLLRTNYISAYGLSENSMKEILERELKNPSDHFCGYASSLYLFATIAKTYNITGIHFKSVISWGDKMFPHFRKLIEEQFHTKVFDTYGCTEGLMIAAQKDNDQFYVMTPHVFVEILDEDGKEVKEGEIGHVVVTRLDAYAMPLIRYYLGDLAVKGSRRQGIDYEFDFPLIDFIIGRDTDIIRTLSGKFMIVHSFTGIFEHVSEIKQFKIIQKDLNGIEIEYIKDNNFSEEVCRKIEAKINGHLKEDFPITWREVDDIKPTPSGKPQIIQSFLPKSDLITASQKI